METTKTTKTFARNALHKFIPANFHDPVGLAKRLMRTKDPAALFAMKSSLLGLLLTPLALLLEIHEKKLYKRAPRNDSPIIIVVGAPRSGTTLVAQSLIKHLPVCYFDNLTSIFPRSPITANLLFKRWMRGEEITYKSYYGKSLHLSGPNDALYLWDRWLGKDRKDLRKQLSDAEKKDMLRFFYAYLNAHQKPLVCKNNSLNVRASKIAGTLKNAQFICLTRDPVFLAQSLLKARNDIHGNVHISYGIGDPDSTTTQGSAYIEDVCNQVLFHETKIREQQRTIGADRFWIISYESFCREPEKLVQRVSERILDTPVDPKELRKTLKPFHIANTVKVSPGVFAHIKKAFKMR